MSESFPFKVAKRGWEDPSITAEYYKRIELSRENQERADEIIAELPEQVTLEPSKKQINLDECTILDLGAGTGIITDKIKDRVGEVLAMDKADTMVSYMEKRFEGEGNVKVVQGDMTETNISADSVEVVVCFGAIKELPVKKTKEGRELTIEEIEDEFLKETMKTLKPGGVCLLDSIRNANNNYVRRDFQSKREEEIASHQDYDGPIAQRTNIFLTDDIRDESDKIISEGIGTRLKELGYVCQVETILDPEGNHEGAAVRITLLEKLDQEDEA